MATPMHFVARNTQNITRRVSFGGFSLNYKMRIPYKTLCIRKSSKSSQIVEDSKEVEEEDEDFFGIPKGFKLQQVRVRPPANGPTNRLELSANSDPLYGKMANSDFQNEREGFGHSSSKFQLEEQSDLKSDLDQDLELNLEQETGDMPSAMRHSVRRGPTRKLELGTVGTTFGTISFDRKQTDFDSSTDEGISSMIGKVFQQSVNTTHHRSVQDELSKDSSKKSIRNKSRSRSDASETATSPTRGSTNYFDEVYFPHDSSTEISNMSRPTNLDETSQSKNVQDSDDFNKNQAVSSCNIDGINAEDVDLTSSNGMQQGELSPEKFSTNSFIDDQFFASHSTIVEKANISTASVNGSAQPRDQTSTFNEIDEQYFGDHSSQRLNDPFSQCVSEYSGQHLFDFAASESQLVEPAKGNDAVNFVNDESVNEPDKSVPENSNHATSISNIDFLREKSKRKSRNMPVPNLENPKTAYDFAMKIRKNLTFGHDDGQDEDLEETQNFQRGGGTVEQFHQTRRPDEQRPHFERMTKADILILLKQRIIFNHDDFLAIDKPYGLPSVGQKGEIASVKELLPDLVQVLPRAFKADDLHLVQGLDRDVTGPVILAKNAQVAALIRGMYNNEGEIIQKFWAITKGVPNPPSGIIDIPVGEGRQGGIFKMLLRPQYSREQNLRFKSSKADSSRAITEYRTLCSHLQASVVECTLHTNNLKHQIRVHLASGLNTPILGDHKYSHTAKTAPQKLHKDTLGLLKINQAKVRHLGLHLHCRSVVLTNYDGRMLFIKTRPPMYFKDNAHRLKLVIPRKLL